MVVFDFTIIGLVSRNDGTCALSVHRHEDNDEWLIEVHNPPSAGTQLSLLVNFRYTCVTDDEGRRTLYMKGDEALLAFNFYNDIQLVNDWMDVVYKWMDNHPDALQEI